MSSMPTTLRLAQRSTLSWCVASQTCTHRPSRATRLPLTVRTSARTAAPQTATPTPTTMQDTAPTPCESKAHDRSVVKSAITVASPVSKPCELLAR